MACPNWFIGLPVPADGWFDALVQNAPSTVQILHPLDLHATVAFLGPVRDDAALAAWHAIQSLSEQFPLPAPLRISLGRVEPMGNPRRPSALSVTTGEGRDELVALLARLRAPAFAAAKVEADRREPLPHITIARPARNARPAERAAALSWARGLPPSAARIELTRVALFTRADGREPQRRYRIVAARVMSCSTPRDRTDLVEQDFVI